MNQVDTPAAPETPEPESQPSAPRRRRYIAVFAVIAIVITLLAACVMTVPSEAPADSESAQTTEEAASDSTEEADTTAEAETAAETEESDSAEALEPVEAWLSGEEEEYRGIPVGFTEEGFPYRGSLDAPVVLYEYSDFACPFCSRYFVQTEPAINEQYVRDGIVRVVFREFPLEQLHPNAPSAHAASLCVAEQGAANYWEMHGEIFNTQAEWSQNPDALYFLEGLAQEIGVDIDQYKECMASAEVYEMIDAGIEDARTLGFQGTPSFNFVSAESGESFDLVGAQPYEQFATYIDAIAAGDAPVDPQAQAESGGEEIPFWATEEGLTPNPDNAGQTMAGDYFRGNPDAEVVVVEFSDFQCPFCRRHTEDTQPVLDEAFVDTDEVMWVFKHFPLQIHPQAPMAGAAAECAGEQEMFWEMHHLLFEETNAWSVSDPTDALIELAGQLELDTEAFTACLADEASLAAVDADMADGAPFVRGTPTFIVLKDGAGSIIPGALPAESFSEALQGILDGTAVQ